MIKKLMLTVAIVLTAACGGVSGEYVGLMGASLISSGTPCHNAEGPFGCVAGGNYWSLEESIAATGLMRVRTTGEAGGTFEQSYNCLPGPTCSLSFWTSFDKQLDELLAQNTGDYAGILVGGSNTCLHGGAPSLPPAQTSPCTIAELDFLVSEQIRMGQRVTDAGITPIYNRMVDFDAIDMAAFLLYGVGWTISEADYRYLSDAMHTAVHAQLPDAIWNECWAGYVHYGDGLHPDKETSFKCAYITISSLQ